MFFGKNPCNNYNTIEENDIQLFHNNQKIQKSQKIFYFLFLFLGIFLGYFFQNISFSFSSSSFSSLSHKFHENKNNKGNESDVVMFFHISDTHIDLFFNPNETITKGVCHSCLLSHTCPEIPSNQTNYNLKLKQEGYAFGRYGCNPPYRLFTSLLHQMIQIDSNPSVIVFTGIQIFIFISFFLSLILFFYRRYLTTFLS